jgi:hypothetical protein
VQSLWDFYVVIHAISMHVILPDVFLLHALPDVVPIAVVHPFVVPVTALPIDIVHVDVAAVGVDAAKAYFCMEKVPSQILCLL